jgi:hypothetical protein
MSLSVNAAIYQAVDVCFQAHQTMEKAQSAGSTQGFNVKFP